MCRGKTEHLKLATMVLEKKHTNLEETVEKVLFAVTPRCVLCHHTLYLQLGGLNMSLSGALCIS